MMYTKDKETAPKPGSKGDSAAWLYDRKVGAIVLHNRLTGAKTRNEIGFRDWRSCVTGEVRPDIR